MALMDRPSMDEHVRSKRQCLEQMHSDTEPIKRQPRNLHLKHAHYASPMRWAGIHALTSCESCQLSRTGLGLVDVVPAAVRDGIVGGL